MCRQVLFAILLTLASINAKVWNNPVLDGADYPDPGVIKVDGIYYAVTTTNNEKGEKFPIHSSTNLQDWSLEGYLFNQSNFPPYSRANSQFWAPELHKVGNGYRTYFTSREVPTNLLTIGVAASSNILGPYIPQERPLLLDPTGDVIDPTIIQSNGSVILIWRAALSLWARNLTSDGLSFKDDITLEIMNNTLEWEGATVEGPWYVYRNGYHYIFYSGNYFCGPYYKVGVARSKVSPLGPFEKKVDPILESTDLFKGLGHGSVLRDVDDIGWVFVYHGWKDGFVCGDNYRLLFTSSVEWGDDDWPKNIIV